MAVKTTVPVVTKTEGANLAHPAVDKDPRKGATVDQNKIDFNDPTLTGREAVEKSLGYKSGDGDQGK